MGKDNNLAIITARGGSKRIPRKNIKDFLGKPMLAYAIEIAQKSNLFSQIMVSTEDQEIAEVAKKYGAQIPFMRSAETANDYASTFDVLDEVVTMYHKANQSFDHICCIYPCVPLLESQHLIDAYQKFIETPNISSLMPVVRFSYPIQRAVVAYEEQGKTLLKYREPQYEKSRSQDLEPTFHDVGMFYWYTNDYFSLVKENPDQVKISMFELEEKYVQDIDNPSDWEMAELKYKILHQN